ncbi:hypothetical protein AB1Y20_007743 [Prymnesium parvum]|uniref:Nucleosome assembly protein n=1 Tax=Prymnesium parvum TaxID=97485 RepID=A0AB34IVX3_PRYPA|mmetsp:Transcript_21477/g.51593  ORF Transcript_21477/g.51593 Transcript_21477/m.51593 type:complete len:98 (-) Transcript_21477:486-779(-)
MAETGKRRRGAEEEGGDDGAAEGAIKWAKTFAELDEDSQYLYLEHLATVPLNKMHVQFLQGVIGDDDEEEEEFGDEEDDGEEEEEEEGEEDDGGDDE